MRYFHWFWPSACLNYCIIDWIELNALANIRMKDSCRGLYTCMLWCALLNNRKIRQKRWWWRKKGMPNINRCTHTHHHRSIVVLFFFLLLLLQKRQRNWGHRKKKSTKNCRNIVSEKKRTHIYVILYACCCFYCCRWIDSISLKAANWTMQVRPYLQWQRFKSFRY